MFALTFKKESQESDYSQRHLDEDGEWSEEFTFSIIGIVIV
jgi:hypothetical protein